MERNPNEIEKVDEYWFKNKYGAPVSVQLALGDITQLKQENAVDLLVLSSLRGDYSETRTSLIGALARTGIHVSEYAKDKQEDLRHSHHCWISKKLPKKYSYRRFLCFETPYNVVGPHEIVGIIFRALIAMAKDTKTLIMPVLCSRANYGDPALMVKGILRAFHYWTRRGLKLQHMKIVMFDYDQGVVDTFSDLQKSELALLGKEQHVVKAKVVPTTKLFKSKKKTTAKKSAPPPQSRSSNLEETLIAHDEGSFAQAPLPAPGAPPVIMQSFASAVSDEPLFRDASAIPSSAEPLMVLSSTDDSTPVICSVAAAKSDQLTIGVSFNVLDRAIVETIKQIVALNNPELKVLEFMGDAEEKQAVDIDFSLCGVVKFLAVLTPNYLQDASCMDHFNCALLEDSNLLVPILAKETELPRYMTLIQYHDARPGGARDLFPVCIAACTDLENRATNEKDTPCPVDENGKEYDVFISYSQKFASQAKAAMEMLKHFNPNLRCFVDTVNLKTGGRWQKALYDALDSTYCVFCLLSPAYFDSKFCQDELALSKLASDEGRCVLAFHTVIPWERTDEIPSFVFDLLRPSESLHVCAERVVKLAAAQREKKQAPVFLDTFPYMNTLKENSLLKAQRLCKTLDLNPAPEPVVAIISHPDDEAEVSRVLDAFSSPDGSFKGYLKLFPLSEQNHTVAIFEEIEACTYLIPLISDSFVKCPTCMAALHMGVFRNRNVNRCILPAFLRRTTTCSLPSFLRLLPSIQLCDGINLESFCDLARCGALLASVDKLDDFETLVVFDNI
uniref:TIR domain-containing protein n=1 Tax=Mucochytrium quahogii TaxID=96639 RepID=A0A7S2RVX3_9STRA|mmetsp:Transcript_10433/g.17008  ORF Transcript_10433/g.17008 Transcript_10433/m.17008 type:complete len:788 (+) Transcript_10433:126-2489(+)